MRALIQRVIKGKVYIDGELYNEISSGYVILLGIAQEDTEKESEILAEKTINLRIMSDETGKMNHSILEAGGENLVISQFTLFAGLTGGRRASLFN